MTIDEVPAVLARVRGRALPGEVVAHPVDADVLGGPSLRSLPRHSPASQLGVQWGLVAASHHGFLGIVLSATKSSVKPGFAPVEVGRPSMIEGPRGTRHSVRVLTVLLAKK